MTDKRSPGPAPGWHWNFDMRTLHGREVRVETRDGCYRNGRFDGVATRTVVMFGREVQLPTEILVGGDTIPIERITGIVDIG